MENKKAILFLIVIAVLGVSLYFLIGWPTSLKLESQINEANGIIFEVAPLDFNYQNPVKFDIKIDTHSGSLDFDLMKISSLEDDMGNKYSPLEWQGPAPGGHHRSGTLVFPRINSSASKIKLAINYDVRQIFEWQIK